MRKIYNLLALALIFMVSTVAVQAEKRYKINSPTLDNGDAMTVDQVAEFLGQPVVIQSGHMADGGLDLIRGLGKSTTINDANLFVLEADGQNDNGEDQYILSRNDGTGYLTSSFSFESSRARAWRFVIMEPAAWTADDLTSWWTLGSDFTWRTATGVADAGYNPGVIFVDAAAVNDTTVTTKTSVRYLCTGAQGSNPSISNDISSNRLELFTVVEEEGYEFLQEIIDELFTDENNPTDLYNVGSDPGEISQELYDEIVNSYNAAQELINAQSTDKEACEAAVTRCQNAIQAAKDGAVQIAEGYYFFGGTRTAKDDNGNPTNATYDDGGGEMCWTYGETWTRPEPLDMDNAKCVWHLIPDPNNSGAYYIQNFYTGNYVGIPTQVGQHVPMISTATESYLIYPYDKDYFVIESTTLKANPVRGWAGDGYPDCTSLHQAGDYDGLVAWTPDGGASHWQFLAVPQSELDALQGQIEQAKLNDQLEALVNKAEASYEKGFAHSFTDGTRDGKVDVEDDGVTPKGLVKELSQLSFNATETSEGSEEALLDGDVSSGNFYHSIWSSSTAESAGFDNTTTYPYIQADLGKAVQEVSVKMWSRLNGTNYLTNNLPGTFHVWATNNPDGDWTEIGDFYTDVCWPLVTTDAETGETTTTSSNVVGYATFELGASYQYVRLEVTTRYGSTSDFKSLGLGSACFNMSEIRFFESAYDPSISIIEAVDPTVRATFEAAMEKAKGELEAESATQATIDELQAAYDAFLENYPDPDIVKEMISDAKTAYTNSEEGSEMGYYETGARAEYLAAIEAVEATVKDVMTVEEVNAAKAAITAANEAFNAKLHKPEAGKLYYVKSLTNTTSEASGGAQNAYLYASGNSAQVRWGKSEELDLATIPQYVWRLEAAGNGYILRNMLTNEAINSPKENNANVFTSTEADTCALSITSRGAGIFNLVTTDGIYFNAQPTGTAGDTSGKLVTWNSASGNDNSAFTFVEVTEDYDGAFEWPVNAGKWNIITLPVDATMSYGGTAYTVVGRNGDKIILSEIDGEIAAGTPFVVKAEDDAETIGLDNDASDWEALAASAITEAKTVNGLVGTLAAVALHEDLGILYNGTTVICSTTGESASNNSGYFNTEVPTTTEEGDAYIDAEGEFTAINNVVDNAAVMTGNVYTLSGVKVRTNVKSLNDLNGLPAGIYILGNQKVIVK